MNDNVKKIFEMLGVEPNEEFKIEGIDASIYYINESLHIYNDDGLCIDVGLCNLLNGNFKIIKLPKEPKKKKLRDLTPEEYEKWKEKNCSSDLDCKDCIFIHANCGPSSWVHHKDLYSDKFLNQEIEVEE